MNRRTATLLPFLGIALLVGFLAIRPDSFWIDEANSAVKATQPDFGSFAAKMKADRGSDLQMPGYMLALWSWEKVFGCSEKALRSLNILFFAFAMGIVAVGMNGPTSSKWVFLILACTSAYVWAYLSEARPYALQFFGATCIAVAWNNLCFFADTKTSAGDWMLATGGLLVLFASSLSTVFFVGGFGLAFLWLLWSRPKIPFLRKAPLPLVCCYIFFLSLIFLGFYYLWSLSLGAKASAVGRTNLSSLLFSFYEMAGALGLGPSRQSLRDDAFAAFACFWPQLGIYFFAFAWWIWALWTGSFKPFPHNLSFSPLLLMSLLAAGALLIAGIVAPFRLTGRHWMPIFPFILLWASNRACKAWQTRRGVTVITSAVLIIVSLVSCLTLRFSSRHAKDDYRGAVRYLQANQKSGDVIWWAADAAGARFYGLGNAEIMMSPSLSSLESLPRPDWIVLSKPDIYDGNGAIRNYLAKQHSEQVTGFQSFVLYRILK